MARQTVYSKGGYGTGYEYDLFSVPSNGKLVSAAIQDIQEYWQSNIYKHFHKSRDYHSLNAAKRMSATRRPSNTGQLGDACRIKLSGSTLIVEMAVIKDSQGRSYNDFLIHGTPTSPGKYVLDLNRRIDEGERQGTTSKAWDTWYEEFNTFFMRRMERLVDDCLRNYADEMLESLFE